MLYHYTCNACIEKAAGKSVRALNISEHNHFAAQFLVEIEHNVNEAPQVICVCGASMRRVVGIQETYVRGYGLNDKRGAKTDMNLFSMLNNDPYKEHRKPTDAKDLVLKLKQSKDHNPRARRVFTK